MAKLTAAEYKAQEATFRQVRLAATRQEPQDRLLHLGTLVEAAGFTAEDTAFLVQALAWLRVMQQDPSRWDGVQGGLVTGTLAPPNRHPDGTAQETA